MTEIAVNGGVVQGAPEDEGGSTFVPFPKIPRLNRGMQITEKVDGTNGCIVIESNSPDDDFTRPGYVVYAQSRKRILPGEGSLRHTDDNMGFGRWVIENRNTLIELLGPGRHYGEWYGSKINGNRYGLDHKRFALFDPLRYEPLDGGTLDGELLPAGDAFIHTVPLLYVGLFSQEKIELAVNILRTQGSKLPALPVGAKGPSRIVGRGHGAEGVVVWHEAARQLFKVTLENDARPKGAPAGVDA